MNIFQRLGPLFSSSSHGLEPSHSTTLSLTSPDCPTTWLSTIPIFCSSGFATTPTSSGPSHHYPKPMQNLNLMCTYYDILFPQVGTHLARNDCTALFLVHKVIYPNYACRHYVQELSDLVVSTCICVSMVHLLSTEPVPDCPQHL